jgi:hypothetical protein
VYAKNDYVITRASSQDELYHYGVLGMKWGHRKASYSSTGIRSALARRSNEKVDAGFKNWDENTKKKTNAIELGKKANLSKRAYESNKSDKALKTQYKQDSKAYKKALKGNTTYRKGQIKKEVGSDLSRKYLSDAKKVKKQLDVDPTNKQLQKQYNKLMSKHDIERANARRAPEVAAKRSQKKAAIKRGMTMTVKAAATSAAIAGGTYAVNKYLGNHQVTLNGNSVRFSSQNVSDLMNTAKKVKNFMGYVY